MKVVFLGTHGVGKTTVAKEVAKRLGYCYCPIELDGIEELDLSKYDFESRQRLFLEQYTKKYREAIKKDNVIMDSHPFMVMVYTLYFAMKSGMQRTELLEEMATVLYDPVYSDPIDKVFILVSYPREIQKRLEKRGRVIKDEEMDLMYIQSIQNMTVMLAGEYFKTIEIVENGDLEHTVETVINKLA